MIEEEYDDEGFIDDDYEAFLRENDDMSEAMIEEWLDRVQEEILHSQEGHNGQ